MIFSHIADLSRVLQDREAETCHEMNRPSSLAELHKPVEKLHVLKGEHEQKLVDVMIETHDVFICEDIVSLFTTDVVSKCPILRTCELVTDGALLDNSCVWKCLCLDPIFCEVVVGRGSEPHQGSICEIDLV